MQQQAPSQFQALRILYISLLTGMIGFSLISVYIVWDGKLEMILTQYKSQAFIGILFFAGISVASGFYLFEHKLGSISDENIKARFERYRAASVIRWALIELPVMASIIAYMLSRDEMFLILSAVLLGIFISLRPNKLSIANSLGISIEEAGKI